MSKLYAYLPALLILTSCASKISYVGTTYNPTEKVDVFVDEGAIKRTYSIVGKGYVRGSTALAKPERIQSNAIATARQKGADAILIKDYYLPVPYGSVNHTLRTDRVGKGTITIG